MAFTNAAKRRLRPPHPKGDPPQRQMPKTGPVYKATLALRGWGATPIAGSP